MSFRIRTAIAAAAECADPLEAWATLERAATHETLLRFLARDPAASAELRRALAIVCIRAGKADRALEALSMGGSFAAIGPCDALIVDPGFRHLVGHNHNANLYYRAVCESAGLSVEIARPANPKGVVFADLTDSRSALAVSQHDKLLPPAHSQREIDVQNALFRADFRRALPPTLPRLLIAHTTSHAFIEGLADYAASAAVAERHSIVLGIMGLRGSATARHDTYRRALRKLADRTMLRVLLVAETEPVGEWLRLIAPPGQAVCVSPFVGSYLTDRRPVAREGDDPPVAGFVGQTRVERGSHLIPEIVRLSLLARPDGVRWRLQFHRNRLAGQLRHRGLPGLEGLGGDSRLLIVGESLSAPDYYAVLRSIDVMVLPYDPVYADLPSGVAAECLTSGCIIVAPAGSTMARAAEDQGAGYTTFAQRTPEAVAAALIAAVDRFDDLRGRSVAASAALATGNGGGAIRRFIEAA